MIQLCLRCVCFIGLFITGTLSQNCNFLHVYLERITWQNMRVVSNMSKAFPLECLGEIKAFELPHEILSQPQLTRRNIMEAIHEMVIQAFNIFNQYTCNSCWEERHLKQIQIGLHQKLQYLEHCKEEEKENKISKEKDEIKHSGAMAPHLHNLELKRYFRRINNFLKDKKYSRCAWEIVLREMRRCFYYLQKFVKHLSQGMF